MHIKFTNGTNIGIDLLDGPVREHVTAFYKHLQFIDLPFTMADCSAYFCDTDTKIDQLHRAADSLGIEIDRQRCIEVDQDYFNYLHGIFEKNYVPENAKWLAFHDAIHLCENLDGKDARLRLRLRYQELSGPLLHAFDRGWMPHTTTKVQAGDVYLSWQELGKHPYGYWEDGEPNHMDRVLELVKPWLVLRPDLVVALKDMDFAAEKKQQEFMNWWESYRAQWCRHWGVPDWQFTDQYSVLPVGRIENFPELMKLLQTRVKPISVELDNKNEPEVLQFCLEIHADWSSYAPSIEIFIDDEKISMVKLLQGANIIEFPHATARGSHMLTISRQGATDLEPSQMVEIKKVHIDQIDVDQLVLKTSWFAPEYPEPWHSQQKQQGNILPERVPYQSVLAHNGIWQMPFESPFYPYMLAISRQPFQ